MWGRLSNLYSEDNNIKIRYIRSLYWTDKLDEVKKEISNLDIKNEIDAQSLLLLAELCYHVGFYRDSLTYAFSSWKKGRNQQNINFGYIMLFMKVTQKEPNLGSNLLKVSKVKENYATIVEFENSKDTFIIVEKGSKMLLDQEIGVNSQIAKKIYGAKSGDKIIWNENSPLPKKATIKEIKHKYVWAFHIALSSHNKKFPGDTSLFSFTVDDKLTNFWTVVDQLSENRKQITENMDLDNMPFGIKSKALGKNPYETWKYTISNKGQLFRFSYNTLKEQDKESKSLDDSKKLVMSLTSLFTQQYLGTFDLLCSYFDEIITPQHVYDKLKRIVAQMKVFKKEADLAKEENKDISGEAKENNITTDIDFIEQIIIFCKDNTRLVGRDREYMDYEVEVTLRAMDESFLMPLVVADTGKEAILYSDDLFMREFASSMYDVKGVNSNTMLKQLYLDDELSIEDYSACIVKLIESNYRNVAIYSDALVYLALKNIENPNEDYQIIMHRLFSETTSPDSCIRVVSTMVREVLFKINHFFDFKNEIIQILERIYKKCGLRGIMEFEELVCRQSGLIEPSPIIKAKILIDQWKGSRNLNI